MADTRNNNHARHESILQAAEAVFAENGYAQTTMDDIAKRAGVSKGTLYNYFRSKQDLFLQLRDRILAGVEAELDVIVRQPGTSLEKMRAVIRLWVERFTYFRGIGRLVLEFWSTAARSQQGDLALRFDSSYQRIIGRIGAVLAEGVESGEFAPVYAASSGAASVVLAIADGIMMQSILVSSVDLTPKLAETVENMILAGLQHGPADV